MNHRRLRLRVVALGAALVAFGGRGIAPALVSPVAAQGPGAKAPSQLEPVSTTRLDSRLVELTFAPGITNPPMPQVKVRILLPSDYATSNTTYPVLYLLHGAGDTAAAWTDNADGQQSLEDFTAHQPVLVVMPDGGANDNAGWYSDWYNGGAFGSPEWETFHIGELIRYVDDTYRVRTDRGGRAVAGLSMGGFGAYSYAARHPDLVAAAFSFSGFLDTAGIPYLEPAALDALHSRNGTPTSAVWGDWQTQEVRWRGHNPADLVGNLHDVRLWMTTGMGAPGGPSPQDGDPTGLATESAVYGTNQSFDAKATVAGVQHTFVPYPQGGHNWWHWQNDLHTAWPLIMQTFATPQPPPPSFDYESMEPRFDVWGWTLMPHREVTEFLTMQSASASGLTLTGSGDVSVQTPPAYAPMHDYSITVSGPSANTSTPLVRADSSGRLSLDVTLGASHTVQQYTPQERVAEASNPAYWETATVHIAPASASASAPGTTGVAPASAGGDTAVALPMTAAAPSAPAALLAGSILLLPRALRRMRRRSNAR